MASSSVALLAQFNEAASKAKIYAPFNEAALQAMIVLMALWLASFPDGVRSNKSIPTMLPTPFLVEALRRHGGEDADQKLLHCKAGNKVLDAYSCAGKAYISKTAPITALLKINNFGCTSCSGILNGWDEQCQIQWEAFDHPRDAYFFNVQEIRQTQELQVIYHKIDDNRTEIDGSSSSISTTNSLFKGVWARPAGSVLCRRGLQKRQNENKETKSQL